MNWGCILPVAGAFAFWALVLWLLFGGVFS